MRSTTLFFVLIAFVGALLPTSATQAAQLIPIGVPAKQVVRLFIPKIKVNAVVQELGLTKSGAMAVPAGNVDASWFNLGTRPGDEGSAVIGGHNNWARAPGVFTNLKRLAVGDRMFVVDAKGVKTTFVVREIHLYAANADATAIFFSDSGVHLNLITCAGVWNAKTNDYTKRLVIFTDIVPTVAAPPVTLT